MPIVVFEDEGWRNFAPLSLVRHVSQLRWGTRTLLESLAEISGRGELILWGRKELAAVTTNKLEVKYNSKAEGGSLYLSARLRPGQALKPLLERRGEFSATSASSVVAFRRVQDLEEPGALSKTRLSKLAKGLDALELPPGAAFTGSWEMVESNGLAIAEQAPHFEESLELPERTTLKGPASNLKLQESADVEGQVSFDTRLGPVVIREGASIESFSRISGPCFIGARTKVHSALIRGGTSVFEGCAVGGEVENSIIMPHTNKAHHGYVGDSIVGEWVNLGAGSTFSNLKNTYGNVRVELEGKRVDTDLLKLGPVIGDMAKVSIGAMIFAGKQVGTASQVTNLVDENVPPFTYFDGASDRKVELLPDSVIETQKRMMERRGMNLSKSEEALIRRIFESTKLERRRAGVRKGRI